MSVASCSTPWATASWYLPAGGAQVPNVESATRSERAVKFSSRTRTAFSASSGVWIRTPAFIAARVSFVVRLCVVIRSSLVIRPGLGFATAASFGLPGTAAPLTFAALARPVED